MWKSTNYDKWKPEGGDWGWVSSSSSNGNFTLSAFILKQLGFSQGGCPWDPLTLRFDARDENSPPNKTDLSRLKGFQHDHPKKRETMAPWWKIWGCGGCRGRSTMRES
jgi:hypothetical protein